MKIYLLDNNPLVTAAWAQYFGSEPEFSVMTDDFKHFMDNNKVECVVSPGNSKGIMRGGYDFAISEYFGWELTDRVQEHIVKHYKGLQKPGTAFIIAIPNSKIKLIHCPTMVKPSVIKNPKVVKDCTIATLQLAKKHKINSIVIPAFGGFTGKVNPNDLAKLMYEGYQQIKKEA